MKKLLLWGLLILSTSAIFAQVPKPQPNTYINDIAGVLTADQIQQLNQKIREMETKSSVQLAVILLDKLPDNYEIDQYSLEVGRTWHVGNANNGLVYVLSISQRKQRLEVAQGLQGSITDIDALHITDEMKPYLREKNYVGAIDTLLGGINQRVDPDIKEQLALAEAERKKRAAEQLDTFVNVMLWWLLLGVIAFAVYWFKFRPGILRRRKERADQMEKEWERIRSTPPIKKELQGYPKTLRSVPPPPPVSPTPLYYTSDDDDSSSRRSTYESPSRNDDNNDFGNWGGGGGSDSGSSGFDGGGASNDF